MLAPAMAAAFAAVQAAPATPPPPGSSAAAHARAARLVQASPGGTLLESLVAEAESDSFAQCVQVRHGFEVQTWVGHT